MQIIQQYSVVILRGIEPFEFLTISCKGKRARTKNRAVSDRIARGKKKKHGTVTRCHEFQAENVTGFPSKSGDLFPVTKKDLNLEKIKKDRPAGR